MIKIGIGIMASGSSRRMGENKLLLKVGGKSMAEHTIKKVTEVRNSFSSIGVEAVVITPYDEICKICEIHNIKYVDNPNASVGKSESVKLIVREFAELDGIMFLPCDQIFLRTETIIKMIKKFVQDTSVPVVFFYKDKILSPIIFPKSFYRELLFMEGDQGGRNLIDDKVIKITGEELESIDIDSREELEKYGELFSGNGSLEYNGVSSLWVR